MKAIKAFFATYIILIMALLVPFSAFGAGYEANVAYYDYYITKYDINIDVEENNVLHVTENITADFNFERHGIYRTIPYKFTVAREDGSTSRAKIKIRNITCSEEYDVTTENGVYNIKIGDADKYVFGEHDYTISYDYDIGMDLLDDCDELYFNLIGSQWDTYIHNVTFSINMPKEFDASKIGMSTGYYGSTGTDIAEISVDGNTINGLLTDTLRPNESATIRLELPEGYFYFDESNQNTLVAFMIILPFICLLGVIIIWAKFGNDKKIIDVVEYYPPSNMSSLDVAYWYKGTIDGNDVVPLLFELANDGYIAIEENETDGYRIRKLKTYYGKDGAKRRFMAGLFKEGDLTYKSKLENQFFVQINKIVNDYNTYERRTKVFISKSLILRLVCWGIVAAFLALSTFIHSTAYSTAMADYTYLGSYAVYLIAFIISFFVRKRTDEGHEVLQKIKGFKMFLEQAEKARLEELVEKSPEYFYDILPYAYVLGVSDKWVKNFEGIAVPPPNWYVGTTPYNKHTMFRFLNHTMTDCKKVMQSHPQSAASGGGSFGGGGGISGGGFGGGGGGSW